VEAVERAAFEALMEELQTQYGIQNNNEAYSTLATSSSGKTAMPVAVPSFLIGNYFSGSYDGSIDTTQGAAMMGGIINGFHDLVMKYVPSGANLDQSQTSTKGDTTSTYILKVKKGTDGSTGFGIGSKTEITTNDKTVSTDVAASVEGVRCPDANGYVNFKVKVRLGGEVGGAGGGGFTQDLEGHVYAEVNDNAAISQFTVEVKAGTRMVKDGRQVYVEAGGPVSYSDYDNPVSSDFDLIIRSQQATDADVRELGNSGLQSAIAMSLTALKFVEENWNKGGCVKIEASLPGSVQPGSSTEIPVVVRHQLDSSEVNSKLDAALSGGKSVDPAAINKTPGTLTYLAPDKKGESATITLNAVSRRGKATLTLSTNTGGKAYKVNRTVQDVTFTGQICSLDKTFTIKATYPGGNATTTFTPTNSTSGKTSVEGGGSGCEHTGGGTYNVLYNDKGDATLDWETTDTINCSFINQTKTSIFSLPLDPAPDLTCP
jgi:hypothetical protein